MWSVTLPYNIGTFVKIPKPWDGRDVIYGTIVGFCVFGTDDMTVFVSAYKEAFGGEFALNEIELMSDEEVEELIARYEVNYGRRNY